MSLSISPDDPLVGERTEYATLRPADASARRPSRFAVLSATTFVGGIVLTVLLFAIGGWQRRWIADDGLIVLRTVRNLLAGNGPVFNQGERVETNTSTAWTYLVWFFSWSTQARLEYVVLALALTMSLAAVVFAMLGSARLWGGSGSTVLLPAGVLVYVALPPARDYATSGLESGLVICWIGLLWWQTMRWSRARPVRVPGLLALVFVAGLAPLIRPEMALLGVLVLGMIFLAPMPESRLHPVVLRAVIVVVAGSVPLGYQIWRMGYYGLPYPNTAVAKDAGGAKWGQGFTYLWDLVGPYFLWVPLSVLLVAGVVAARVRIARPVAPGDHVAVASGDHGSVASGDHGSVSNGSPRWSAGQVRRRLRSPSAVVAVFVVAGLLLTLYALRVGGDFMHGRMLLPQVFLVLLPVAVLPLSRPRASLHAMRSGDWSFAVLAGAVVGTSGWALFAAGTTAITSGTEISSTGIVDERVYYVLQTGRDHPILAEDYLDYPRVRAMVDDIAATPDGGLLLNSPSFMFWYVARPPAPIPEGGVGHTVYFLNLGMTSMNVPLDVRVIDPMGLAYPLAAHTGRLADGRIGHDKSLYPDWVIADTGMVDKKPWLPWYLDEKWVAQARTALTCPDTQALLLSSRGPLTFERFRHNVRNAFRFADYHIERVPKYEIQRCGLIDPVVPR